jgi:hypothetical protein
MFIYDNKNFSGLYDEVFMSGFRGNIISTSPFLLYTGDGVDLSKVQKLVSNQKAIFIITIWWSAEPFTRVLKIVRNHFLRQREFPEHKFIYLCNTDKEVNRLRACGLDARFCHQNATLDEKIFDIQECDKSYDAIYDAQVAKFKRHYLCTDIRSLAIISYVENKNKKLKYTTKMRDSLSHAYWHNDPFDSKFEDYFMSASDVATAYNQARTGLCLSSIEGAMFASAQYLLCGLPVLNVPNLGGRDFFLHDDVSITVKATPYDVKLGVKHLIESNISPYEVRQKTLKRMQSQRAILEDIINESLHSLGADEYFSWITHSKNKMFDFITLEQIFNLTS